MSFVWHMRVACWVPSQEWCPCLSLHESCPFIPLRAFAWWVRCVHVSSSLHGSLPLHRCVCALKTESMKPSRGVDLHLAKTFFSSFMPSRELGAFFSFHVFACWVSKYKFAWWLLVLVWWFELEIDNVLRKQRVWSSPLLYVFIWES